MAFSMHPKHKRETDGQFKSYKTRNYQQTNRFELRFNTEAKRFKNV